jgi:hypothetical protein
VASRVSLRSNLNQTSISNTILPTQSNIPLPRCPSILADSLIKLTPINNQPASIPVTVNAQNIKCHNHLISTIIDSGTSHNLIREADCPNVPKDTSKILKILFPNGTTTTSLGFIRVHLTEDDTPMEAHVCNDAALNQALLSVKVLCDMHYKLLFAHDKITIISPTNKVITKGIYNPPNWNINLEPTIEQSINQYVITHQLNAERVAFYHAAFGSPTISTFLQAIHKGFLTTIPELTFQMVRNNPPISLNIEAGHMKRHRQGLRTTSTKPYESERRRLNYVRS